MLRLVLPDVELRVRSLVIIIRDRLDHVVGSVSSAVNVFEDLLKSVEIVRDVFQSENVDLLVNFLHICSIYIWLRLLCNRLAFFEFISFLIHYRLSIQLI